jgi:hypothetical protein
MRDVRELIQQHRSKGVLVDTNLLVLYLVGKVNRKRIPSLKGRRLTPSKISIFWRT